MGSVGPLFLCVSNYLTTMTTYTIREPLLCDYIGQFDSDQEFTHEQAIEYANTLEIDWEPEYELTDINRSFSVCVADQALLPASTKALVDAGIDHRLVANYITGALGENIIDEVRGILETGILQFPEEAEEEARELILEYVRDNLVITFANLNS